MDDFPIWSFIFLILILPVVRANLSLAPFVPSKSKDLERINKLCALKPWENFVEIGCGNAKVSMYIAKNNQEVNVLWIELSYPLYIYSKIKTWLSWVKNLQIKFWNAFNYDFSETNVVYVFGLDKTVSWKLSAKLWQELPKQARYVSYVFNVNDWKWEVYVDKPSKVEYRICVCKK
jgi:16S rRNA A1518/A1519 N6-dimethyltransferase RsmA/KsgA/DIM1 with predicted DNA glycosylase/AP lyase activity